nr:hypothetical protein CFP56_07969 [Quercus suber]POE79906.1 hypothetical protein CFP56_07972 [Quercus suber]
MGTHGPSKSVRVSLGLFVPGMNVEGPPTKLTLPNPAVLAIPRAQVLKGRDVALQFPDCADVVRIKCFHSSHKWGLDRHHSMGTPPGRVGGSHGAWWGELHVRARVLEQCCVCAYFSCPMGLGWCRWDWIPGNPLRWPLRSKNRLMSLALCMDLELRETCEEHAWPSNNRRTY